MPNRENFPEIFAQIKTHLQSFFNFTVMNDTLNTELAQLTTKSFQRLQKEQYV